MNQAERDLFRFESGTVKYVRVGEEYRFVSNHGNHSQLVTEDENPCAAGFVHYETGEDGKFICIYRDQSSFSLRIGPLPEDSANIAQLLGFVDKSQFVN